MLADAIAAVVLQGGDALAGLGDFAYVNLGADGAGIVVGLGDDLAPRVDDEAVAISLALIGVGAGLCRSDDKAARLDCAGAQQRVPMRLAGGYGEGRWHGKDVRAGLCKVAV